MLQIQEMFQPVERPIKVVQFGTGNFLRAFADYMIDEANGSGLFNGNIAVIKSTRQGSLAPYHEQKNLYTTLIRGKQNGKPLVEKRVITSIGDIFDCTDDVRHFFEIAALESLKYVLSNTTESGIVFVPEDWQESVLPASFPGKLTRMLYHRFQTFSGNPDKGLIFLPTELIEDNGATLKKHILDYASLWELDGRFATWIEESCVFCNTLVDRIVTGYPKDEAEQIFAELGYFDQLLDVAEPFSLWVIESRQNLAGRLPFLESNPAVVLTSDLKPYRERKVRVLNGAHTATVMAGYLMGKNTVLECMEDPLIDQYMQCCVQDVIVPTINMPKEEAIAFANSVFERFENPYLKHSLLAISLNSVSKWRTRILPTLRDHYQQHQTVPSLLAFSFAALLAFYTASEGDENSLTGRRGSEIYPIRDDAAVLKFFLEYSSKPIADYVAAVTSQVAFWGEDLSQFNGFNEIVGDFLTDIRQSGMREAMRHALAR